MSPDACMTETLTVSTQTAWTRIGIGLASTISIVGCFALAESGVVLVGLGVCDGDAGSPYAARASTAGQMCTSTFDLYSYVQIGLPVALMTAFGTYAVVRARWSRVLIGVGTSIAVTVTMFAAVTSLPRSCGDEQRRTLDPYECERY